jgi:hypothetical protein
MSAKFCVAVFGLLFSTSLASAAPRCDVPLIRTLDNQTVSGTMYATSGRPCGIVVQHTNGPMFSAELVQIAKNGKVVVAGGKIVYTSRPGYVGEDQFTYARRGMNNRNEPVVRTVNVTVQVAAAPQNPARTGLRTPARP